MNTALSNQAYTRQELMALDAADAFAHSKKATTLRQWARTAENAREKRSLLLQAAAECRKVIDLATRIEVRLQRELDGKKL